MTREEAIKILKQFKRSLADVVFDEKGSEAWQMAIKALSQEPKTGHREYNDIYDHYLCGNCKTIVMDYDNFCPNCGARMVEPKERSDKE